MAFIKLDRDIFESKLWLEEPFTHAQAWVDLIAMANYADKTKFYKGSFQKIKRGQIITSQRTLAERWKWSKAKVATFIRTLVDAEMVTTDNTSRWTVLTIVNYAKYQDVKSTKRPQTDPQSDHGKTTERPRKGLQEEYKERKENIYTAPPEDTQTKEDYGGVFLSDAEWDELEGLVKNKGEFLQVIDRVGEWLQDNPRPKSKHKSIVKTFLRNDGLI